MLLKLAVFIIIPISISLFTFVIYQNEKTKINDDDFHIVKTELNKNVNNYVNYSLVDYRKYYSKIEINYKSKIDVADGLIEKGKFKQSLEKFNELLEILPNSPRCIYAKTLILDKLSIIEESNSKLKISIDLYSKLFDENVRKHVISKEFFVMAALRLINRLNFFGKHKEAVFYNKKLCDIYPNDIQLKNELGIGYILINNGNLAKQVFEEILIIEPNDPIALVHLGFVLKQFFKNINESITYLQRGIDTMDTKIMDSRFFFHLGDALQRNGETDKAYFYYQIAVENGLFLSTYQRSIYNVPTLKAKPWWDINETNNILMYALLIRVSAFFGIFIILRKLKETGKK